MIIIGAGGLAKEIISIVQEQYLDEDIYFFDNIKTYQSPKLFSKFKILKNDEEVKKVFEFKSREFIVGVGGIENKINLTNYFLSLGGELKTVISKKSFVGTLNVTIGLGSIVFPGVKISNDVTIGSNCLIYYNSIITHDCKLGDNVEVSPSVNILGGAKIGSNTWLGSNSTILPKIVVGDNSIVGAGSVVNKNVGDNLTVIGVPAKVKEFK